MRIGHATPCCDHAPSDSVLPPSTIQLRHVTPPHAHSAAAAAPPPMADPHPHLDSDVAPPPPQPPSAGDAAPAAPPPSQPSPAFELSQIPEECARPSSPSVHPSVHPSVRPSSSTNPATPPANKPTRKPTLLRSPLPPLPSQSGWPRPTTQNLAAPADRYRAVSGDSGGLVPLLWGVGGHIPPTKRSLSKKRDRPPKTALPRTPQSPPAPFPPPKQAPITRRAPVRPPTATPLLPPPPTSSVNSTP